MWGLNLLLLFFCTSFCHACIPSGVDSGCNCQGCPACAPPPSPLQCPCGGTSSNCDSCGYSNQGSANYGPSPYAPSSYLAPATVLQEDTVQYIQPLMAETQAYPTANNQLPQIPSSPQIFEQNEGFDAERESEARTEGGTVLTETSNSLSLEQAVQYYNRNTNQHIKLPPNESSSMPKVEFNGLPSIYYASYDSTSPTTTSSTSSTTSTLNSTHNATQDSRAYASGTFVANQPLDAKDAYQVYEAQVCAGVTLGRSTEPDGRTAAEKCAQIGCAAANLRLLATGSYEVIYLKTADLRKYTRSYDCISTLEVPVFENDDKRRQVDLVKQKEEIDFIDFKDFPTREPVESELLQSNPKETIDVSMLC